MFVSMDVVFREHEPFYEEPTDLTDVFPDLFNDDIPDGDYKTGGDDSKEDSDAISQKKIVGVIPTEDVHKDVRWSKPNEEKQVQVYKRRHRTGEERVQGEDANLHDHNIQAQAR